jgi:hypothetical protein|tara:strand:- start:3652 stop:4404 length:753 start_codon:yes stop_codon:yes gene_type:complete
MADNFIKDTLKDILRHTHNLGIFEMLKIAGTVERTDIVSVDTDKVVIFIANTKGPVPEFVDSTIGWNRLPVLDGYLKMFNDANDTVEVITEERNGEEAPTEIALKGADGNTANFRFMPASIIDAQLGNIEYLGSEDYDVSIVPTQKNLKDLTAINGILGQYESMFIPKVEDGALYFHVGDAGADRSKIKIADVAGGTITRDFSWPLDVILKILRLGDGSNVSLNINNQGVLKIVVDSGIGEYKYYLPAQG